MLAKIEMPVARGAFGPGVIRTFKVRTLHDDAVTVVRPDGSESTFGLVRVIEFRKDNSPVTQGDWVEDTTTGERGLLWRIVNGVGSVHRPDAALEVPIANLRRVLP